MNFTPVEETQVTRL